MESNRSKRRGFMKGKLMPFYRATKPASSNMQYSSTSSKVIKPSQSSPSTASVGFINAKPKQKVSYMVPAATAADHSNHAVTDNNNKLIAQLDNYNNLFGLAAGDESVDIKAATYISSVQERFKLERINSERMKCQEMQ